MIRKGKRIWINTCIFLLSVLLLTNCSNKKEYDIVIYGGTSAGVIAAYSAHMMGKSVLLIEPGEHLGGLSAGGLGETDIGNKHAVTGLSRDFYRRLGTHYGNLEKWRFEPHVAEKTFHDYIREANVEVFYKYRIIDVEKEGTAIQSITLENSEKPDPKTNKSIKGKIFLDCTYEGDLMARTGVSYRVGREDNSEYNETYNGVQLRNKNQIPDSIDPYIIPGDSTSGLIYGINPEPLAPSGSGDNKVQAYNFRLCMTNDTSNFIPVTRPKNYDSTRYEILARILEHYDDKGWKQPIWAFYMRIMPMPNNKTDINNKGGFSTNLIGASWEYPEASYEKRKEIIQAHEDHVKGFLWFMGNDPRVPEHVKEQILEWGWAADEFVDNDHFPHQIYVREARRMVGEYVMTEHHCLGKETIKDGIAMGAYNMDSHNTQRVVVNGMVKNEGDIQIHLPGPYDISYRSITPKREECTNLLVPVCISATHIAFGSIRMEPVFMMLGQSAAMAASMAIDNNTSVQEIDIPALQETLQNNPYLDGRKPEIYIDNDDEGRVELIGDWDDSFFVMRNRETALISLENKEPTEAIFDLSQVKNGEYRIYFYCLETPSRRQGIDDWEWSEAVDLVVKDNTGEHALTINQAANEHDWVDLGVYTIGNEANQLRVIATGNENFVNADAIVLFPL